MPFSMGQGRAESTVKAADDDFTAHFFFTHRENLQGLLSKAGAWWFSSHGHHLVQKTSVQDPDGQPQDLGYGWLCGVNTQQRSHPNRSEEGNLFSRRVCGGCFNSSVLVPLGPISSVFEWLQGVKRNGYNSTHPRAGILNRLDEHSQSARA